MKIWTLMIIFIVLISADKLLTLWNMQVLAKNSQNNPDYLKAEKNVAARWCFEKLGLIGGTILFGIVTLITLSIAYYSFSQVFDPYKVLWVIFIIYGIVVFNNSYYLLKNTHVI